MLSTTLMKGKRGLIMGVANDHSIAWGIAHTLASHGAELAFTYQSELLGRRVTPLAQSLGSNLVFPCDVEDLSSLEETFSLLEKEWESLDFIIHAVAYSEKDELKGKFVNITRENFSRTMLISCFSFTEVARLAAKKLMLQGGSLITLTFEGSVRVMPNYNAMGMAKAALESSVRYLAVDLGKQGIRVNAISPGPVRTLAGAGIADARTMFNYQRQHSPLQTTASLEDIGGCALYLASDLSACTTGNVHFVDAGYNIISMPRIEDLKNQTSSEKP